MCLFYFIILFFSKDVLSPSRSRTGVLRLGGRHLGEDVSDVRGDDYGEGGSLASRCLEQRGKTLKTGEMWRLWEKE